MTRTASGTEITLENGDYRARIVSVGAGIAGLTYRGHDIVQPHDANEIPVGWSGKTLTPWPNRIEKGEYSWKGTTVRVPVNDFATGTALHGLMAWVDWEIVECSSTSVVLTAFVAPRDSYPWALDARAYFHLDAKRGLEVTLSATNVGTEEAPYGVSTHPYLCAGAPTVNECTLEVPAERVAIVDEHLIPTHIAEVEGDLDFRGTPLMGTRQIDHAYTALPEGEWSVVLRNASGEGTAMTSDAPWVQIYSGENMHRVAVAVEPMTCAPNAFNTGQDLLILQPGQSHDLRFRIHHVNA